LQLKEIIEMPDFGSFRGFGEKLVQGQTPTQLGKIGSENFGYFGVLDLYPTATVAYSLRLLRNTYTGNAIRVRRGSDNTEQNIGFNNQGGLDTAALTSFCSGTNGFVTTWYDQSGNANNFTQSSAGSQPQIVSSGSILTQTGIGFAKPSILFATSQLMQCTSVNISGLNSSLFLTHKKVANSSDAVLHQSAGATYLYLNYSGAQYYGTANGSINDTNSDFNTSSYLLTSIQYTYTGTLNFYKNNVVKLTAANRIITGQAYDRILGTPFGGRSNYYMSEMILYSNNQLSNLSAINTNINTYYGIY
jgi:hypothetical protein